jgi:hypothetical protein
MAKLEEFCAYFNSKKLANKSEVLLYWSMVGDLQVLVTPPMAQPEEYAQVRACMASHAGLHVQCGIHPTYVVTASCMPVRACRCVHIVRAGGQAGRRAPHAGAQP